MGYLLFGIESLTCGLLFVALGAACMAHLQGRWLRLVLVTLVTFVPLVFFAAITTAAAIIEIHFRVQAGWFWWTIALSLTYLVGAILVVRRAVAPLAGESRPGAIAWSRGKLAAALAVALMLHAMTFANLDAAAKQTLGTVRAEATSLALSVAPPRLAESDNAAVLYEQIADAMGGAAGGPEKRWAPIWNEATEALDATRSGPAGPDASGQPSSPFDFRSPTLGKFLEEQSGVLALIRQAANKRGCYFDRDYGRPTFDMLLPELQGLRNCARLLAIDARWAAEHDDLARALSDVDAIYAVSLHAGSEPIMVSLLVAGAFDHTATDALRTVLDGRHPTLEQLAEVHVDPSVSYRRMLRRCLRLEEAFILNSIAELHDSDLHMLFELTTNGKSSGPPPGLLPFYRVFLMADDITATRAAMRDHQRLPSLPFEQFRAEASQLTENMRRAPSGIVTSLLLPSITAACDSAFRNDAERRLAETALAMHRYYAVHGHFPDRLAALAPAILPLVPHDPFDDQPIRLKTIPQGWILYSVGANQKDEGGKRVDNATEGYENGDLTFEYTQPRPSEEPPAPASP